LFEINRTPVLHIEVLELLIEESDFVDVLGILLADFVFQLFVEPIVIQKKEWVRACSNGARKGL
jgi:hypothetical protein